MLAHDFVRREPAGFLSSSSSKFVIVLWGKVFAPRSATYFFVLLGVKVLRCVGIFLLDVLLRSAHVVELLWTLKLMYLCDLLKKPLSQGKPLRKTALARVAKLALLNIFIEALWLYGITLAGPLRSVLVWELSPSVVLVAALHVVKAGVGGSAARSRGCLLLGAGLLALFVADKDYTMSDAHLDQHGHQRGLNDLFYTIFSGGDHKAGILVLLLSVAIRVAYDASFRQLSVELGGGKRLHALVSLASALLLTPLAITSLVFGEPPAVSAPLTSWLGMAAVAALFVSVFDFYAESICFQHLADPVNSAARWAPAAMWTSALVLAYVWYPAGPESQLPSAHGTDEFHQHPISGGVFFAAVAFTIASFSLTSSTDTRRSHSGKYVKLGSDGLPLFTQGEAFLERTSRSVAAFARDTLAEIMANADSRRIFYFLLVNLAFCGVEFLYGWLTNSLGLISDAFHMLFDCSSLVMGLVASVMARWPATRNYSYGFGRVEVLSGFINAMFLNVIALFILLEALERLYDPPHIDTDKLMFVAVAGLAVNLFGLFSLGEHGHSHGGGGSHGHSHGGDSHGHGHSHGHSHGGGGNANMWGVYLHVLADTLGSVFVIISTLLLQWFGWAWVDPLCSMILAVLILGSSFPLLKSAAATLLQCMPSEIESEWNEHLHELLAIPGVVSYSDARVWQLKDDLTVASVHLQCSDAANDQSVRQKALHLLKVIGATQTTVQVEKEAYFTRIAALWPTYRRPTVGDQGVVTSAGSVAMNAQGGDVQERRRRVEQPEHHGHSHNHDDRHHGHSHS